MTPKYSSYMQFIHFTVFHWIPFAVGTSLPPTIDWARVILHVGHPYLLPLLHGTPPGDLPTPWFPSRLPLTKTASKGATLGVERQRWCRMTIHGIRVNRNLSLYWSEVEAKIQRLTLGQLLLLKVC